MIKIATEEDRDLVLSLANARIAEVYDLIQSANKEEQIILLSDDKGVMVASTFNTSIGKIATDILWYVSPENRGSLVGSELLEAFEYWAKKVGCTSVCMTTLNPSIGKAYFEERGYVLHDTAYIKEL